MKNEIIVSDSIKNVDSSNINIIARYKGNKLMIGKSHYVSILSLQLSYLFEYLCMKIINLQTSSGNWVIDFIYFS